MFLSKLGLFAVSAHANWAWLSGSQRANTPPSHQGLFIETPSVTPGCLGSSANVINGSYIITFGGYSPSLTNSVWRYNIESGMWSPMYFATIQQVEYGIKGVFSPFVIPAAKESPVMFLDTVANSLFVFGGYPGYELFVFDNNMFEFSLESNMWRWIHGPGTLGADGVYGELGVEANSNTPPVRHSTANFYDRVTRRAYVYGGYGYEPSPRDEIIFYADHWMYSVTNNTWTWIHGVQNFNAPAVFGEQGVGTAETMPGARVDPSFAYDVTMRKFYMFGGGSKRTNGESSYSTDVWLYEPDRNIWTFLVGDKSDDLRANYGVRGVTEPGRFPRSRVAGPMVIDSINQKLYLFSGLLVINGEYRNMNDLWVFDIQTLLWTWIAGASSVNAPGNYGTQGVASASNNPSARGRALMVFHNATGQLFMFGGRTSFTDALGDMWTYFPNNTLRFAAVSNSTSRTATSRARLVGDTKNSNQTDTFTLVVSVAVSIGFIVLVALFILIVRLRTRKNVIKTPWFHGSSPSTTSSLSHSTTTATLVPTSMGLALPAHLLVKESDYRFGELLASGGGGDVYVGEATSARLANRCRKIVVKLPKISNDLGFKLFEQEVSIMYLLRGSRFVAKLVGFSTAPPIILMKMYPDGSLQSFASKRPLNRKWKVRYSLDIARGLQDIHNAKIAHCDMKPQNVLIDRDPNKKPFCVITDFGIAQVLSEALIVVKHSEAVNVRGLSVQYAAPEVFTRFRRRTDGNEPVMKAGDIYALGMILKFVVCKTEPWDME